ncbi:hypothetical protein [Pedobacter sp. NJ-S-72]
MSDYAVVFQKNNLVYKASNFGGVDNIFFTKDGKVAEFIYAGRTYYAIYQYNSTVFLDYVDKEKFEILMVNEKKREKDKYHGVDMSVWKNIVFIIKDHPELTEAVINDDIYGVLRDETGLCFYFYTWKYTSDYKGPNNPKNAYDDQPRKVPYYVCEDFTDNPTAKTFYDILKDKEFYDLETKTSKSDARLVAEVASLIKTVNSQMLEAFNQFTTIVGTHGEFKIIDNPTNTFYKDNLISYRDGLKKWLQIYAKYKNELKNLNDSAQLYVICDILYRYNMLGTLSVDQKISILITFCKMPLMDWYFSFTKELSTERDYNY